MSTEGIVLHLHVRAKVVRTVFETLAFRIEKKTETRERGTTVSPGSESGLQSHMTKTILWEQQL